MHLYIYMCVCVCVEVCLLVKVKQIPTMRSYRVFFTSGLVTIFIPRFESVFCILHLMRIHANRFCLTYINMHATVRAYICRHTQTQMITYIYIYIYKSC